MVTVTSENSTWTAHECLCTWTAPAKRSTTSSMKANHSCQTGFCRQSRLWTRPKEGTVTQDPMYAASCSCIMATRPGKTSSSPLKLVGRHRDDSAATQFARSGTPEHADSRSGGTRYTFASSNRRVTKWNIRFALMRAIAGNGRSLSRQAILILGVFFFALCANLATFFHLYA
ncbi:hypothetical protein FB567DRAFT_88668 [Paraphoma chrysanthemicola]|uniref:Uncharacterized protein n=1 Tax=Paraphoma chrysanthemicola TaxID=798071 RepID=A0A8K0R1L8_9PLEO|nr:hypothetical protein FB567DRAFT_88668 [Paraphoma chrysanthemicola]